MPEALAEKQRVFHFHTLLLSQFLMKCYNKVVTAATVAFMYTHAYCIEYVQYNYCLNKIKGNFLTSDSKNPIH